MRPTRINVLGKEGRKIILAINHVGEELEICDSLWLNNDLHTIDIDMPYSEFGDHTLNESKQKEEEEKEKECKSKM